MTFSSRLALTFVFFLYSFNVFAQTKLTWETLSHVKFEKKFSEELGFDINEATFDPDLQLMDGQEVIITGYMIPMDVLGIQFVVSQHPNASCFFCGKAGPETVVQLFFKPSARRRFKTDERLTLKGMLKLNKINDQQLTYIMNDVETH